MATTATAAARAGSERAKACSGGTDGAHRSANPAADMARFTDAVRAIVSVPKAAVLRVEAEDKAARKASDERTK
jgi:hypothetical protein